MENPPLENVIEKLEKLDIREWKILTSYRKIQLSELSDLTARTCGIIINLRLYCKRNPLELFNDLIYSITLQDENKKVFIEYKEGSKKGEVYKFYEKLCKKFQEFKKESLNQRLKDLIYELGSEKKDIEKIIERLESVDPEEWETDLCFHENKHKPKYPRFTINLSGLKFCVKKGILRRYTLEIKDSKDSEEDDNFAVTLRDQEIGHFYEKLYKNLKNKEENFKNKLEYFLTE